MSMKDWYLSKNLPVFGSFKGKSGGTSTHGKLRVKCSFTSIQCALDKITSRDPITAMFSYLWQLKQSIDMVRITSDQKDQCIRIMRTDCIQKLQLVILVRLWMPISKITHTIHCLYQFHREAVAFIRWPLWFWASQLRFLQDTAVCSVFAVDDVWSK